MCGILGYVGNRPKEFILYGLKAIEYRGYDSVGLYDGRLIRSVGKVDEFLPKIPETLRSPVIAHTRWATHGGIEERNAHPHKYGKIVLVHNGTVDLPEFPDLKSDTDTERIAALLNLYLEEEKDILRALYRLSNSLDGVYSLAIILENDNRRVYFAKRGTPLIIGVGYGEMFLASDIAAFIKYTREYIRLEDGDYGYIERGGYKIFNNGIVIERPVRVFEGNFESAIKGEYPHFMLKEIHEQRDIVESILPGDLKSIREILRKNRVDGIAAGSSYHAILFIKYLTKFNITPYISSEYPYLVTKPSKYIFTISQSGETIDTINSVNYAKSKGAKVLSLTNYLGSTLAAISDYVIPMNAGIEIGVAATKTFLTQILFGYKLIGRFDLNEIKQAIDIALRKDLIQLDPTKKTFFVGKGINYPIAMEGALKLKEISYVHAEAFAAGEMKHGPLSLFDENSQTVFIHGNDESYQSAINNYKEIIARGSKVFLIDPNFLTPNYFHIAAIVYLQRLAYDMAVGLGRDPDKPRFLAKAVTVE